MISVIDYGAGNLRSVTNVLEVLNVDFELVRDAQSVRKASKIILPGVGHFGHLASALDELAIRHALIAQIADGVPYLGICLGMQILFSTSAEAPNASGLGVMAGSVQKFAATERIPHMGWNTLDLVASSVLINAVSRTDTAYAYFAHSFFCPVVDSTVVATTYGIQFSAVIEQSNIFGVQFHPEKSGDLGRLVIQNFVNI